MNYYILKQGLMNEIALDEVLPDSIEPCDWLKGEMTTSPPENLVIRMNKKNVL